MLFQVFLDTRMGPAQAVFLRRQHVDELAATDQHGIQPLGFRILEWARHGFDSLAKLGNHLGVKPVCFGKPASRFSKIAHLARVDHRDRQPGRREPTGRQQFQPSGGF